MTEPQEAEQQPPEQEPPEQEPEPRDGQRRPEWSEADQVVNLDEAPEERSGTPEDADGRGANEPPDQAEEPKTKLEDDDPDSAQADEAAAYEARVGGLRGNLITGERSRVYQSEKMSFFGGEPSALPRHGPVPALFLDRLRATFAEPPCHREMVDALTSRSPVQCYVGEPGTGRTTAAIMAAVGYLRSAGIPAEGNVRVLASERGLAAIDETTAPRRSALVLALGHDTPGPDAAWFGAVAASLKGQESALVVVSARDPQGPAALSGDHLVRYLPPGPLETLRRHLARQLGGDRVRRLLAVPALLAEAERCRFPREAAALAADVLARVDKVPDEQLVAGRTPTVPLDGARGELIGRPSWQRDFLITATVLDEQPAGTVTRQATRLAELHEAGAGESASPRTEWFTGPMAEWSGSVELVGETSGDGSGRTVRLIHPRLAAHLLEVIWQDHIGERDTLLAWMRELGAHPQSQVRVKVAHAAAQLASYDFDVMVREVIQVWALDGGFRTRQTCSWALEALALAGDGRFARKVRGLVNGWTKGSNVQLLAAGATAYGTFLGAKDPAEALERMRAIIGGRVQSWNGRRDARLDRVEREIANIVQRALLDVFAAGAEEQVVHELAEWTLLPHWRWRHASARALLELAGRNGRREGWPLLAELAAGQPLLHADLVLLWCNALHPRMRDERPWEALHRWVERGARDPELGRLMGELLDGIRADRKLAESLDFHREVWEFRKKRS